jgi:BASS family bile acid:Na+ symporter
MKGQSAMLATLIHAAIPLSVFCNVFALALEARPRDVIFLLRRPFLLLRSMLSMYLVMVAFAVALVTYFHLGRTLGAVLVVLSLSPVPPALPLNNRKAGGSQSYAIGLLVTAVLVALVTIPLWVEVLGQYFHVRAHISAAKIAPVVTITVLAPIFCGIAINHLAPSLSARLAKPVARLASLLLIGALLPVLVLTAIPLWQLMTGRLVEIFAAFVCFGLLTGHFLGGPDPRERMILALATSARHPGVAITITAAIFPELRTAAMAIVIWYLLITLAFALPYVLWSRRRFRGDLDGEGF